MGLTEITPELCAAEVIESVPLVMRFLRAQMRHLGAPLLSVPQLRSLIFLNRYPGASLSEVAEHLGVTKATASAIVENLVQKGLVNRQDHPQERRRHVLTLSETGLQQLNAVREATRQSVASVLINLTNDDLLKIVEGITLLANAFKDNTNSESDRKY